MLMNTPTKYCSKCLQNKAIDQFSVRRSSPDGLGYICRGCSAAYSKFRRHHTAGGRALAAWHNIRHRLKSQKEYAGVELRMTREEFMAWAVPRFRLWLDTKPDEVSTVDRVDPGGHYEITNIRLLERGENARLRRNNLNVHAPEGQAWCGQCKAYKPRTEFESNKSKPNGLQGRCRPCRAAGRIRRRNHRWRNDQAPRGLTWCSTCQSYLPVEDFYASSSTKSGLQGSCKKCQNSRSSKLHSKT